jgi:hypothetical protein
MQITTVGMHRFVCVCMSCFVHLYSFAVRTHMYAYVHVSRVHVKTYVGIVFTCTHIRAYVYPECRPDKVCVYEYLCMHVFGCTSDVCMEAVDFSSVEMYDMVCMYMHPYACRHACAHACLYVCICLCADRRLLSFEVVCACGLYCTCACDE